MTRPRDLAGALLLALALTPVVAAGAPPAAVPAERTLTAVHFDSREELQAVASRYDVWEVHREEGWALVLLRAEERDALAALGYRMTPVAALPEAPLAKLDSQFAYYDKFVVNARNRYLTRLAGYLSGRYPGLTQVDDLGLAWEGNHGGHGRHLAVLRITNEDPKFGPIASKPAFFLMAEIHAREVATPELAFRYALYLLTGYGGAGGYGSDADATWLVDHHVLYLLFMQNPDGHSVNEADTGAYRRKNNDTNGCGNFASSGVDLNRNHSFLWGCCNGSSGFACDETYRGTSAGSEPETQAFQQYFTSVMGDFNGPNGDNQIPPASPPDTRGVFITLHSYADEITWPWAFRGYGLAPNDAALKTMARKMAFYNGYSPTGDIGYDVDGATDDWVYGKLGIPGFTIEVGSGGGSCGGFFPDYRCLDGYGGRAFWTENRPVFLWSHKIAGAPYVTAYGPDTLNPTAVPSGSNLAVTATVDDQRLAGDTRRTIVAAEAFVDAPGAGGTGTPLAPADGAWDETREGVTGNVDLTGVPPGTHYLLVRGKTANDTWGPFTAVFFTR